MHGVLRCFHKHADCRVLRPGAHEEGFAHAEAAGAQGLREGGETGSGKDKIEKSVMNKGRTRSAYEERKGSLPAAGCVVETVA